ncbi:MAG: alpha/beta hydrolase, partial [Anaerolineaceae bacterium]|nr:alpha/beta hydrolase [Anaerolineaceae bacterium]
MIEKMTFNHSGLSFSYYQTGAGDIDIFMQHGYSDTSLCWADLPFDLGKNYHITMLDARGHGYSDKPKTGYDLDTMSEDIAALIKYLNLNKPVFIGHSMGGSLGAHTAALYPDLFGSAVLIDPAFRERTDKDRADLTAKRTEEIRAIKAHTRNEIIQIIRKKHPVWPDLFIPPSADGKILMSIDAVNIINNIDASWKEDLKQIACPILLITADVELGAIVTPEISANIQHLYPNVELLHIPGAGHSIQREKLRETLYG